MHTNIPLLFQIWQYYNTFVAFSHAGSFCFICPEIVRFLPPPQNITDKWQWPPWNSVPVTLDDSQTLLSTVITGYKTISSVESSWSENCSPWGLRIIQSDWESFCCCLICFLCCDQHKQSSIRGRNLKERYLKIRVNKVKTICMAGYHWRYVKHVFCNGKQYSLSCSSVFGLYLLLRERSGSLGTKRSTMFTS